jgi:ABC-type protease/lipase transport system fused ATPase/permease subunit
MKKLFDIKIAPPLLGCFDQIKGPLAVVAGFSFVSNLLFFALPLYLMQVYGRVLVSHSLSTLLFLTIIAIFAFAVSAVLDDIRSRILVRVGSIIDKAAAGSLFSAMVRARIAATGASEKQAGSQTARDLDSVRQGIAGNLTTTMLDLPWTPIFLAAIFAANFWIGFGATLGRASSSPSPSSTGTSAAPSSTTPTVPPSAPTPWPRARSAIPRSSTPWAWRRRSASAGRMSAPRR